MENRIRELKVRNGQLIPAAAEVWITVIPEQLTPATEVRGRLMGPRCPYSSTVEVAYPLRLPPPNHVPPGTPPLTMRVVIPEASLWEPESPFLYQGPIELWENGRRCDQVMLSHGLRYFGLGEHGLRINGRPLALRGRTVTACTEEDMRALRQAARNLLIAPVEPGMVSLWERADRLGFFVLGQVSDDSEEILRRVKMLSRHTSCLGWLIDEGEHPPLDLFPPTCLLGLACHSAPQLPLWMIHFLAGPAELARLGKPLLVRGDLPDPMPDASMVLGSFV